MFVLPHCCCALLSTGWFTKVGKISLLPSSAVLHEDAIPVKYSLLTLGPAFYPVPSVLQLSWNPFNLRKICCLWQSLPSLVIILLQVLCGSIQRSQCLPQPIIVSGSCCTVRKHFWDDSAPSHPASLWWLQLPTMTMSCSIRHRTGRWRHCQPSRGLLWLLCCRLLPGNNQQEEFMDQMCCLSAC